MISENFLYYVIQAFINLSVYVFFVLKTFDTKFRYSKKVTSIIAVVYVLISVVIIELFFEEIAPFREYIPVAMWGWALLSVLFCFFSLNANPMQILFFVLTVFNISYNVIIVSQSLFNINIYPHIFVSDEVNYLFLTVLVLFSIIPMIWYLLVHLFKKAINLEISAKHWKPLFALPLSYFLFSWLSQNNSFFPIPTGLHDFLTLLMLYVSSFFAYVAVLKMLLKTYDSLKAATVAELNEQMLLMQQEEYKVLKNNIEKTAQARHDMRHHMIAIRDLAECGELKKLNEYLGTYFNEEFLENDETVCENHFVDIILRHYIAEAKINDIHIDIKVEVSNDFKFPNPELCIVFGNLIENAIESCMRLDSSEKFIELKARMISKSMLAISMNNSCDDKIIYHDGKLMSTKHKG
ncbi:MAG: GHKL domain-containing protein, partial [Oscillospiraceae bacterium]